MSFDEVSQKIMLGEKIYNLPLRVCFYARVSTGSDVQVNSLDNQLSYYEEYIKTKRNWQYAGGYIEEGVSGVRVDKREKFKQMIKDAEKGKFDLIITKEVSRFARDLEDSIHYIRKLKNANVGVFFENQNLNTFDANSELVLNIMFNLAQDESRKLSSRVKFGHRQAIEKGHVLGSSNIMGYKKDKCKLVIVPEEADFIKKLFELYATGKYGFYKLAKVLASLGYKNKKQNLYDKDSLKRMLKNPKYKGYYRAKTYEIIDYRTKKRKKISEDEQIIYKCNDGSIPAIVSEELWNKANEVLKARTKSYTEDNYWTGGLKYPLSSKIYCKEHNTSFQRSHGNKQKSRPTWSCGMYLKYRIEACTSPIITEKDLYNIIADIMMRILPHKTKIIEDMHELYSNISEPKQYAKEIEVINRDINLIEAKKSMVLDLVFNGELKKDELKVQFKRYENELRNLYKKKQEILKQREILNESYNTSKISKAIQEEIEGGFLEAFIRKFVEEIIVSKIEGDRNNLKLDIFLNLLGAEKVQIKGARHIEGAREDDIVYLEKQSYPSFEKIIAGRKVNKFTYNVYVESL